MSQPDFITHPSYDLLHVAALTMTRSVRKMDGMIDAVIAPVKGGLMFGMIAAEKLNVPLITLHYSSSKGRGNNKNHSNILPAIEHKTLFCVDDISDSGETLKEIVDHYTSQGHKVVTAVFHYKESSIYHPDLYFWRIPSDSEFIVYPHENN